MYRPIWRFTRCLLSNQNVTLIQNGLFYHSMGCINFHYAATRNCITNLRIQYFANADGKLNSRSKCELCLLTWWLLRHKPAIDPSSFPSHGTIRPGFFRVFLNSTILEKPFPENKTSTIIFRFEFQNRRWLAIHRMTTATCCYPPSMHWLFENKWPECATESKQSVDTERCKATRPKADGQEFDALNSTTTQQQ